jgi:tRNA (cmo5U34)-methyltransferase
MLCGVFASPSTRPALAPASSRRDALFADPSSGGRPFRFDHAVAEVFDDMASRSIPLYAATVQRTASLCATLVKGEGTVVDLGASTGALLRALGGIPGPGRLHWVGVDASAPMLERVRALACEGVVASRKLVHADVADWDWADIRADVVVCNWTLHFVPPDARERVLLAMHRSTAPGGWLVLSEKMLAAAPSLQAWETATYWAGRRDQGYSQAEIDAKTRALEGVLVPWTLETWQQAWARTGWRPVSVVQAWAPFVTWMLERT